MPTDGSFDHSWFCLRSQPGRQSIAAAYLRSFGVEVFNPQLRLRRATRRGVVVKSEPLFTNYLFARFDFEPLHRRVRYTFGVGDLVRFGGRPAVVPRAEIESLRARWGADEALTVAPVPAPGDRVRLSGALFHGMEAEVLALLPARERVQVLLDFLGGPKLAEVAVSEVVPIFAHPLAA